jgi:hypothetical protein
MSSNNGSMLPILLIGVAVLCSSSSAAGAYFMFFKGDDPNCIDENKECPGWAAIGECEANPGYMLSFCRKSCNTC